jgi:hypothetical protein
MEETQKHKEAFEHFYLKLHEQLSVKDSIISVAETFKVTERTVWSWKKKLKWEDKIAVRDAEIQEGLEEKTNTTIIDNKAKYLGMLHSSLNKYVEEINTGEREPLPIESTTDLVRLIRESLLIQNQPTEIQKQDGSMKHEISGNVKTENVFTRVDKLVSFIDAGNAAEDSAEEQDPT